VVYGGDLRGSLLLIYEWVRAWLKVHLMTLYLIDKWAILKIFLVINCWLRESSHLHFSLWLIRLFSLLLLLLRIWISPTLFNNEVWSSVVHNFDFFERTKVISSLRKNLWSTKHSLVSITLHVRLQVFCLGFHHVLVWPQHLHMTVILVDFILLWLFRLFKWRLRNSFY